MSDGEFYDYVQSAGNSSAAKKKTINIRDLFIEPNFNELEVVASDSKGEPKKLSHAQLESLRRTGEFQVNMKAEPIMGNGI